MYLHSLCLSTNSLLNCVSPRCHLGVGSQAGLVASATSAACDPLLLRDAALSELLPRRQVEAGQADVRSPLIRVLIPVTQVDALHLSYASCGILPTCTVQQLAVPINFGYILGLTESYCHVVPLSHSWRDRFRNWSATWVKRNRVNVGVDPQICAVRLEACVSGQLHQRHGTLFLYLHPHSEQQPFCAHSSVRAMEVGAGDIDTHEAVSCGWSIGRIESEVVL